MSFKALFVGVGFLSLAGFLYGANPDENALLIVVFVVVGGLCLILALLHRPNVPTIDVKVYHDAQEDLRRLQIQAIEREMNRAIRRQKGQ